jgi:hypothetical protein
VFTQQPFSSDNRTRVLLFVTDFDALNGDTMPQACVMVQTVSLGTVSLPIEHIAKVPGFDWLTQIEVVLPPTLDNAGDVWVSVHLDTASTNQARLRIIQAGVAASEAPLMNLFKDPWILPDFRYLWPIPSRWQHS